MEATLEIKYLGKRTGTTDTSIINRIQEMEERISGIENTREEIDTPVKENAKYNKFLTQNIQEIWDKMKRINLRIIGIEGVKIPSSKARKHLQQNIRGKFSHIKK